MRTVLMVVLGILGLYAGLAATGCPAAAALASSSAPSPTTPEAAPPRSSEPAPPPSAAPAAREGMEGLEPVSRRIPDAIHDFRYATANNFMKRAVYPPQARCLLRARTAERLAKVAERLRAEDGTRLLLYDCYRPLSVQRLMWEVYPVRGYVAPPSSGSIHNRGAAVDLSLADKDGGPLPMPTDFDVFSERAWPSFKGAEPAETKNRDRLRAAMLAEGFTGIRKEWWHYEDPDERRAPLLDQPFIEFTEP